jgi:outer membrane immunogenic protein
MKKVLLSTAAALGVAMLPLGAADAADYSAAPVFDWSGFYAGLHGGYLHGDIDIDDEGIPVSGTISGFVGGALAGYNFATAPWLWGVEADVGFGNPTGSGAPSGQDAVLDLFSYDFHWNAHFRGRVGVPVGDGSVVPFLAGGLALAGFDVIEEASLGGTYVGGTIGGGVDVAFSPTVFGRAEILYDAFGSKTYDDYTVNLSTFTARLAIAVKFPP